MNTSAPPTLDGTALGPPRRRPPRAQHAAPLSREVAPPSPSGLWALLALLIIPLLFLGYCRAVNRRDWEQQ